MTKQIFEKKPAKNIKILLKKKDKRQKRHGEDIKI